MKNKNKQQANHVSIETNGTIDIDGIDSNKNVKINLSISKKEKSSRLTTINQIQKNAEYAAKNRLIITIGLAIISVIILLSIIFYSQPSPIPKIKSKGNVHIDMSKKINMDIDSNISVDGSAGKSSSQSNSGTIEDKSTSWFTPWNIIKQIWGWMF